MLTVTLTQENWH